MKNQLKNFYKINKMSDSERIKKLLNYLDMSANKLSKELGLATPQVFYDIKSGRCGISKELARKIKEKYININVAWLLTGEGDLTDDNNVSTESIVGIDSEDSRLYSQGVPLVDIGRVGLMEGDLKSGSELSDALHNTKVLIPFPDGKNGDLAIRQYDDSMAPIIPSGSVLLIRKIVQWKEYLGLGSLYVIILVDGRRLTRNIIGYDKEKGKYLAKSYNNEIEGEDIPISMIYEVWKVVSILSLLGW